MDEGNFKDKQIENNEEHASNQVKAKLSLNFSPPKDIHLNMSQYSDLSAFHMNWPIMAFANRKGQIFLLNAFHRSMMQVFTIEKLESHEEENDEKEFPKIY